MEKESKFPLNQQKVAGRIENSTLNPQGDKLNLTIVTPGEEKGITPKYLKVYISGAERVSNFLKHQEEAKANGMIQTHVPFVGSSHFSKNESNSNVSLIVTDKLQTTNENFQMPKTEAELTEFNNRFNSRAPEVNQLKMIGILGTEPEIKDGPNGKFATALMIHNYKMANEDKTMAANVIIPTSQLEKFTEIGFKKGSVIKIDGQIQPRSYTPKDAKEPVYTFNVVSREIIPDLSKMISKENDPKQQDKKSEEKAKDVKADSENKPKKEKKSTIKQ